MKTVQQVDTRDYVIRFLKENIFNGQLPAGSHLIQEDIAERLGISRQPVREAFQALEQEGFLIRNTSRRIQVAEMGVLQIVQTIQALSSLEQTFLRMDMPDKIFIYLREAFEKLPEECPTKEEAVMSMLSFHHQLGHMISNPCLLKIHEALLYGSFQFVLQKTVLSWSEQLQLLNAMLDSLKASDMENACHKLNIYFESVAHFFDFQKNE